MQRARRVVLRRAAFVAVVVATMAVTAATASASIATAVTAATATAAPTATTAAVLNRTPVADAAPVWRSVAPSIDAGSVVTHPAQAASAAAVLLAATLVPGPPSVRRGRIGDLTEVLALLSLVPLLVLASGLFARLSG